MRSNIIKISSFYIAIILLLFYNLAIFATQVFALTSYPPTSNSHYLYVFPEGKMYVYDIDNNFSLVYSRDLPTIGVRGVAVSAVTDMLYLSYGSADNNPGSLLKYNLITNQIVWTKDFPTGVDSLAITPDGQTIYLPTGEFGTNAYWYVINATDGSIKSTINAASGPHNTAMSLDGKRVYLSGVNTPYLKIADTSTNSVTSQVGQLISGGRPFTINGTQALAFTTATGFLGFQVSNIVTGSVLHTVEVAGYSNGGAEVPSHGITISPDEREVYVLDGVNNYVHLYDVTALPSTKPTKIASIKLSKSILGSSELGCSYDCEKVGWLMHSKDGKYVFVGDSGDIIDTSNRQIVKNLDTLSNTRKFIEVDWQNGSPSSTTTRHGLGYVTSQNQTVTSYSLINADTDQPISGFDPISSDATINLTTLPTKNLNIRANTNPASVGSVKFAFDGNSNYRIENNPPYALASDEGGNYYPWTPSVGSHSVSATPFSGANASGSAGTSLTLNFNVIDQAPNTQSISSYTLINADTDQPISGYDPIAEGVTINLAGLPTRNLNIRANSNPQTVGSVKFAFDGNSNYRVENNPPYALASDEGGNYAPWTPSVGTHTLSATPFSSSNASGTTGNSQALNFTISDQSTSAQSITSYTLINADTDQPISGYETLVNNSTISIASLPTGNLNIRANTNPASVGSVRFGLDGNSNYRIENVAPYALASDEGGNYYPWPQVLGSHSIIATPFTQSNASGSSGNLLSITLNFTN